MMLHFDRGSPCPAEISTDTGSVVDRPCCQHQNRMVADVAVTPDGLRAVSASGDKTLKVWDLDKGLLVTTFYCDAAAQCCACADNHTVIAGDEKGRVYFLALEPGRVAE